jgi:hypothetical protein
MNKKTLIVISSILALGLVAIGTARLVQYLTPTVASPEVYERVEAERYEVEFPKTVNYWPTYGSFEASFADPSDTILAGVVYTLTDEDEPMSATSVCNFVVYCDGGLVTDTAASVDVLIGAYGRYVISSTQVVGEPTAYTLVPIYDYVLVE